MRTYVIPPSLPTFLNPLQNSLGMGDLPPKIKDYLGWEETPPSSPTLLNPLQNSLRKLSNQNAVAFGS